jgi:Homing endonuclease associated repeat
MGIAAQTTTTNEAYCPHCFLLVEQEVKGDWPHEPTRCPHCRLLIGPGRGRPTPEANPGARGSAAGVFAHQAKREDGDDVSQDEIRKAIRRVADELGSRPERLLMVDYQQRASGDATLPTLSDVFSAFGSWKRARREAAV